MEQQVYTDLSQIPTPAPEAAPTVVIPATSVQSKEQAPAGSLDQRVTALEGRMAKVEIKVSETEACLSAFMKAQSETNAKLAAVARKHDDNLDQIKVTLAGTAQVAAQAKTTAERARYGGIFGWAFGPIYRAIDTWRDKRDFDAEVDAGIEKTQNAAKESRKQAAAAAATAAAEA